MKSIIAIPKVNRIAVFLCVLITSVTLQGILEPAYGQWTKHFMEKAFH
jgi:hypothetical protein